MYKLLIIQPCYGEYVVRRSVMAAMSPHTEREDLEADYHAYNSSALTSCFNVLWCRALNEARKGNCSHVVMIHSDVVPEIRYLDKLVRIMEQRGDDLVSTAIAIKDRKRLTSCGLADPNNQFNFRRFTLKELHKQLPPTFAQEDVSHLNPDNWTLIFNTGLWIANLQNPKWRELDSNGDAKFFFTMNDKVRPDSHGDFRSLFEPEDWFFSRLCAKHGIKYSITREVKIRHHGEADYTNEPHEDGQEVDETWRQAQCV